MSGADRAALRPDIQALRGFAVAVVILYHAGLGLAPAGFLGVDVFFVVSGFLIGGHALRGLDEGSFRFASFYLRRIRRLAPAAMTVLLATVLAAHWLLTPEAHTRFAAQALGGLGYLTNVVLWRQINYFNTSAASEPLLHMWSLAIEEQFYLMVPLALWLLPRRWRGAGVLTVTLGSLAGYLLLYPKSPGLTFYLLPTRAWELGLGVFTAIMAARGSWLGGARRLALPALALVLVPAFAVLPMPQHLLAVPACIGTALLLLAELAAPRWLAPLERVGDASYSLYLVHWPLFAFAHVLWLGSAPPLSVALGLVALSGLLGWLLYRWVEQPGRFAPAPARRVVALYLAASVLLAGLVLGSATLVKSHRAAVDLTGVTGLDLPGCDAAATQFDGRCTLSPAPDLLVWGDSFSQQLVPALQTSGAVTFAQASKGQCAPLLGLAPVDRDATPAFAQGCLSFNRSVIDYLRRTPSVKVVLLSGNYPRYAQAGTLALRDDGLQRAASVPDLQAAQQRTSAEIRALGKRVVVVTGPPQARFDVGQCWARRLAGQPLVEPASNCAITAAGAAVTRAWSEQWLAGLADTPVLRLDRLLCPDSARCETAWGGVALYRDGYHLGAQGSRVVGEKFKLYQRVIAAAR